MPSAYDPETIRGLERLFEAQKVFRPFRLRRYEPGTVLEREVRGVWPDARADVKLEIERFVGGGYAGQVYKVRVLENAPREGEIARLAAGGVCAMKVLVPPSGFSRAVRNLFYFLGFQGPFSLQANAAAGRSQALWQKFIRRAAGGALGSESAVADIFATFHDPGLGSYGEIGEWVEGRVWRFEVDDDLDVRSAWNPGTPDDGVGSPEYRAKRVFMTGLVRLLHDLGAVELARQYEWWSLKSQPNALKRTATDPDPRAGLVAVDFRAGMALTPLNPQCPVDFKLIARGIGRGRLVQFDKGDVDKLAAYVEARPAEFADLRPALEELRKEDAAYRDSLVDLTFHHVKLLGRRLRRAVMSGFRESWRVRNMTDERAASRLERSGVHSFLFLVLGALPALAPFALAWAAVAWKWEPALLALALAAAGPIRRLAGRADLRRHLGAMATRPRYFLRAGRARIAEALVRWVRGGRVSEERALALGRKPWRYYLHAPLSVLPPGVHRFLTDKAYFKERLRAMFVQPARLYFRPEEREKWLKAMISEGEGNGMLSREEAARIVAQLREPFIQKYLKSLAVHVATLFVSETVYVTVALTYIIGHPDLSWQAATLRAGAIVAALNLLPVSPGSLVRGFYVVGLMIKERNFRDYNIAFGVSFLKMLGYLAFPIQMAYRYPDLARFMAGHWATGAVHVVPIFGERGAWLEHFMFDAFYNFPLTLRRRIARRAELRKGRPERRWHAPLLGIAAAVSLWALGMGWHSLAGRGPAFSRFWWIGVFVPIAAGISVAAGAGSLKMGKRIALAMFAGALAGALYGGALPYLLPASMAGQTLSTGLAAGRWAVIYILLFGALAIAGAVVVEIRKVRNPCPKSLPVI